MVTGWALYLAPPDKMFRQIVYNVHIFKFYSRDICYEVLIEIHAYIMERYVILPCDPKSSIFHKLFILYIHTYC